MTGEIMEIKYLLFIYVLYAF